jgi:rhodanese-related sulfurtransferase
MLGIMLAPTILDDWMRDYPYLPGLLFAVVCLLVLFLLLLPRLGPWLRGRGRPVLDPVQVDELILGSGALVVDLRGDTAFRKGHIRGCLHVPFEELPARFVAPDPKARRALILVDETDAKAHQAFDLLTRRGFSWLYVMKGGMRAWRQADRPIAK